VARLLRSVPVIVFLAFPVFALAQGAEEGSHPGLLIQMEGGLLTVKARDIPHRQILEGLARRLGFELIVGGPLDEPRSLELHGKPWEEALKKALHPASWVLVYEPAPGRSRLAKVMVFPLPAEKASPSSPVPTALVRTPAKPVVQGERPVSAKEKKARVEALKEQLLEAEDAQNQAAALYDLATLGGAEEVVQAMFQLGGQQAVQELQEALEGQTEEVRQAVQDMLGTLLTGSQSTDRP